jgi:SSS family solute:Na+ symporter
MAACALLVAGLLTRGGLRSDVLANRFEIVLMYGGFALILPFAALKLGGAPALKAALPAGHWDLTGGLSAWQVAGWWLIAVWTVVDPSFHQRCAAASDPATARRGILISILFWAAFDAMTTTAGLYARAALPALSNPLLAYPTLADRLLPPLARGIFLAALAGSVLAALQAQCLLSATSLGKDGLGRLLAAGPALQSQWTRRCLFLSAAFSVALAWAIPSVIGLWWAIGSVLIPGLLLPFLGVYFPRLRRSPAWMLAASIGGVALSGAWLIAERRLGQAPLGVAPMFPGLALSACLWAAARLFP